ncbi:hypothetical protein NLU13_0560 [Sarocladium strictum]|uniref:DUF2415 domain-containing protein n=1 Tax=Sarocladium strictum TaxID=5046 RepID=A0AA39GPA0_SARSR|nr:hypothetical protein NLU13_0560 [Sarocladium strictum]
MAVKDNGVFYPTDIIISKRGRRHYKVPVRSQHWQLRSLISAEKRHIVYFPGGSGSHHIQRLNTRTHECETIKLLTFAPRCLVAEGGWLCCGSEKGDFVAIRLDGPEGDRSSNFALDLDPEVRLPFGLELSPERESSLLSLLRPRPTDKSFVAKSSKMAKDRVNCITLWFPTPSIPTCDGAYTSPVAVLANNDRTVTLVSLEDFEADEKSEPLATNTYPDFVNRAIISPDGRLLIAILDDPYLYVHERTPKSIEPSRNRERRDYRWELKQRLLLKSQRKDDKTDRRGSFAACFSSSGEYLAVGTQHGTISIFQTALLSDPDADPLVTTFTSSQPESLSGAVRDMAFCPGPFDILAWTEDRAHIGIADIRTGYTVRQIVDINVDGDFEHINVLDRNTVDPRLLERRSTERRDDSSATGPNRISEGRRRLAEGLEALNHPLTTDETMVLEAIRGDRRRRERPGSDNQEDMPQRSSSMTRASLRPTAEHASTPRTRDRGDDSQAVADLLSNYRVPRNPREALQERINRRRQMLLDANMQQQPIRRNMNQLWLDQLADTVSTMRDGARNRQDQQEYLTVLEILQARERVSAVTGDNDQSSLPPISSRWQESAVLAESALRGTLPDPGVLNLPPSPDNTAGLAWSEDGRTLFVGAQNGIYEFQVNVQSRKYCPVITLR